MSKDCYNAINATLQTRTQNTQDIVEANFQGGLFKLPAGEVRVAAGFQGRRNKSQFNPDILQSEDSFTDQVVGVYPTGYLDASTSVKDYYVEALVPVLNNIKGIKRLELELGARYSDYRETDSQTTWKALVNWEVTDWARLRGGFNRATLPPSWSIRTGALASATVSRNCAISRCEFCSPPSTYSMCGGVFSAPSSMTTPRRVISPRSTPTRPRISREPRKRRSARSTGRAFRRRQSGFRRAIPSIPCGRASTLH